MYLHTMHHYKATFAVGVWCRLVRQMLETKQKSQAEAEEEKRKMQQSALAKYRQAFAIDTEVHRVKHWVHWVSLSF